jgi:hypothetical protein
MRKYERQIASAHADQKLAQAFSMLDDTAPAAIGDLMEWVESEDTPTDTPAEWLEFAKLCISIVMLMYFSSNARE